VVVFVEIFRRNKHEGLRTLFKFYKRHWGYFVGYALILIIMAVINFFEAMYVAKVISNIMDAGDYDAALKCAIFCLAMGLVCSLLSILNTYFYKQLENKTKIDIQQMVLRQSLEIQMKTYDKMGSGVIVTRLTGDINALSTEFKAITSSVIDLLKKAAYVFYIFALNKWLGIYLFGAVVITILVSKLRVHYFRKLKPGVNAAAENVNSRIIEIIRGVKDIKTLNCGDATLDVVRKHQIDFSKKDNKEWYVGVSLGQTTNMVRYLCNFFFIFLCICFLREEALTPLIFYTCFLYKDNVLNFSAILENLQLNLGSVEVYARRIFKLIDPNTYDMDVYGDDNIENYSGSITFENVSFGYDRNNVVLTDASFEINSKQTVAFVGESGCGKTTILNLISHMYYKTGGNIYFDGVPIENLSREFVKKNIAVVNQFPYIFNLSIRDNFRLIRPEITDEEIFDLCRETNICSLIESLPDGLDSVIGENGCQFSGGQKQKLCIARALARRVKILIFDEATSALDNANQTEIMKVIEKLKDRVTIILVAHRLSTITYADCIYLMEKGKVVDRGTHAELLNKNEFYKSLYNVSNQGSSSVFN
jgi:ATP-binding cassette subfamily B protein